MANNNNMIKVDNGQILSIVFLLKTLLGRDIKIRRILELFDSPEELAALRSIIDNFVDALNAKVDEKEMHKKARESNTLGNEGGLKRQAKSEETTK